MIPDKVKTKSPQAPWRDPVKPVLSKKNKKKRGNVNFSWQNSTKWTVNCNSDGSHTGVQLQGPDYNTILCCS